MDIKTLEYLEERSSKGRSIVKQIEKLTNQIEGVKKARGVMDIYTPTLNIRPNKNIDTVLLGNNYETELVASIYNTFINVTNAEIERLKKELAEL
ncbi:hypothetical protein [Metabacillus halosaccharovorans]|uniref:Uncharacterized protein n=1 Tax=Metabacillus halosaccharovorans TaxID=930124 RepID=A0ABT3DCF5_9BACI|nr:hypothetical protein [Metabacillus halosaccharovorans]MCV9884730.1 hypothetical protein [Metabacillus halosaccharovorans]